MLKNETSIELHNGKLESSWGEDGLDSYLFVGLEQPKRLVGL